MVYVRDGKSRDDDSPKSDTYCSMPYYLHLKCHRVFQEEDFVAAEYHVLETAGATLWKKTTMDLLALRRLTFKERVKVDATLYVYPPLPPALAATLCTAPRGDGLRRRLSTDRSCFVGLARAYRKMHAREQGGE